MAPKPPRELPNLGGPRVSPDSPDSMVAVVLVVAVGFYWGADDLHGPAGSPDALAAGIDSFFSSSLLKPGAEAVYPNCFLSMKPSVSAG